MIKIVQADHVEDYRIRLRFNDGHEGVFDASPLIARQGTLLDLLRDPAYFKDFFIELGALCWKNGLELSADSIYRPLAATGKLTKEGVAA